MRLILFIAALYIGSPTCSAVSKTYQFPKDFMFGASTAAYQVEGAVKEGGKGENIWDRYIHDHPERIAERATADIACDSYHKYKEDVQMLKEVGFHHYRFSISWSRILPNGHESYINKEGVQHYHDLIDNLLANDIIPFAVIYHWDLPQPLQDLGGWSNPVMAQYFERFALILFREYGNKVKWWTTFNEPLQLTFLGYGNAVFAPGVNQTGIADFLATHTVLIAHASVYRMYKKLFYPTQKGKIGITLHAVNFEPKSNSSEDKAAAEKATQFMTGIFAHPIFSKEGDYDQAVKDVVDKHSKQEGWFLSRLPRLTPKQIKLLKGSADFLGINHYTSMMTGECKKPPCPLSFMLSPDAGVVLSQNHNWASSASSWLQAYPEGVRKILVWIKNQYNNPPVIITEAGWSTEPKHPNIEDTSRIQYYHGYLQHVLQAINEDKCNILGFTAWALMDTFEWISGYTERFGLYYVDFNDPNRTRTKRKSADFFKTVIATKTLPDVRQK